MMSPFRKAGKTSDMHYKWNEQDKCDEISYFCLLCYDVAKFSLYVQ